MGSRPEAAARQRAPGLTPRDNASSSLGAPALGLAGPAGARRLEAQEGVSPPRLSAFWGDTVPRGSGS